MGSKIVAHFNPDGIPEYLKQRPQWIVWGKRTRQSQNALLENGKLNRIPFNPRTGKVALSDEPKSWGTYEQAIDAYQSAWYNGIGFMPAFHDGLVGIILNHCFLIGTNRLLPEAELILARFETTFAEIFPSGNGRGNGLNIYCFGLASRCGKGEHARWIELYGKDLAGRRTNRYICVTGHQFSKTREITNCQASLYWLYQTFKACATPAITSLVSVSPISKESSFRLKTDVFKAVPATRAITLKVPATTISDDSSSRPEKPVTTTISDLSASRPEKPVTTTISDDSSSRPEKPATTRISDLSASRPEKPVTTTISDDKNSDDSSSRPEKPATTTISDDKNSDDNSLSLKDEVFRIFDEEVSKVQQATLSEPLFQSASTLNELCNSAWAAPFITKTEVETALLNATTLPYNEAQRTIASALQTATGTREEPTSTVFNNAKSAQINWQSQLSPPKNEKSAGSSLRNIALILKHNEQWLGVLGYNEFTRKIVKLKPPPYYLGELGEWQDTDDTDTAIWLEEYYALKPSSQKVSEVIKSIARHHKFHPVRDYLNSLNWDGKPRVDNWLSVYLGALDTEYTRLVGKTWLISAIARIMMPGCKVDNVLILEGEQGIFKSTALRLLCQDDAWFNDTPFDLGSKDAFMALNGKWIIELAELDSFNKADSARAKAFFSSPVDTYREPYGRNTVSVPRQCVFAGSVNKEAYLKDETGNRRYLPVECRNIDLVGIKADRDQLWAEAYQMYRNGEPWWTNANDPIIKEQQEARFETDVWESLIVDYLEGLLSSSNEAVGAGNEAMGTEGSQSSVPIPKAEVTMAQLLQEALQIPVDKQDRRVQTRVGGILKRLGWKRIRRRCHGKRRYVYTNEGLHLQAD
jgi:predicted P-loop ATPase